MSDFLFDAPSPPPPPLIAARARLARACDGLNSAHDNDKSLSTLIDLHREVKEAELALAELEKAELEKRK